MNCLGCGANYNEKHRKDCPVYYPYAPSVSKSENVNIVDNPINREKASELLKHTEQLINGDRARDYGDPHESFEKIAKLWSTYLHHDISVTDVGMMMILLKVARNGRGRNKPDNFVDICGYASLTGSQVFKNDNSK